MKYALPPLLAFAASSLFSCAGETVVGGAASDVSFSQDFIFSFDFQTVDIAPTDGVDGDIGADGPIPDVEGDAEGDDGGCLPSCTGRQCGPDGCGGTCGSCGEGLPCVDGLCPTFGNGCSNPLLLPYKGSTLSEKVGFVAPGGTQACQGPDGTLGAGNADATVRVLSSVVDRVRVEVKAADPVTIHHVSACGPEGACLAESDTALVIDVGPASPVALTLESGVPTPGPATVTLRSCRSTCNAGSCSLDACGEPCPCSVGTLCSSGACVPVSPGDSCAQALSQGLPLSASFNLASHTDAVGCRTGDSGRDRVYRFEPDVDVRLTLAVESSSDVVAFATSTCGGACGPAAAPGAPIGIAAGAGEALTVVVEGPAGATGQVTFAPCEGCGPACPCFPGQVCVAGQCASPTSGDSCAAPLTLTVGSNVHSTNGLTDDQACLDITGGRDAVLRFTAPKAGEWGITVEGVHPMKAYTLASCGDPRGCRDRVTTPATLRRPLSAGESILLVVEQPEAGLDGGFEVRVEDCVAACSGLPCDAVVCGAACGCGQGQQCSSGACVNAVPGDSCAAPTLISAAPVVTTLSMEGLGSQFACGGDGEGRPEYVVAVPINASGIYAASVAAAGASSVHALAGCRDGARACAADLTGKTTLFRGVQGQLSHLVVEASGTAAQLSVVKATGIGGGVGSACESSSDCPWADRCVAGFCTSFCDGDAGVCDGAAAGPRGAAFACPTDVCVDDGSGCHAVCLPSGDGDATVACDGDGDCAAGQSCTAALSTKDGGVTGFCAAGGGLAGPGETCASSGECRSNVCLAGRCAALCGEPADCPSGSCVGEVVPTSLGELFHGVCVSPGLTPCTQNADCVAGACDVALDADGHATRVCRPVTPGAAFGVGDPCLGDSYCTTGRCLFSDALGLGTPYCSRPCNVDGDCGSGLVCRSWTVWNGGTPADASDDVGFGLCVRGSAGAVCNAVGTNLCDPGLSCVPTGGEGHGVCQ